jgi:hypothetical protein
MRIVLGGCMVVLVVLAGTLAHVVEPLVLYDDFNAAQIDAGKWVREEEGAGTERSSWQPKMPTSSLWMLRQGKSSGRPRQAITTKDTCSPPPH